MTLSNACAFPADYNTHGEGGLTKREYFAAMAMQGIMAAKDAYRTYDYVVAWSVKLADALIEELNKSKDNGTD